MISKTGLREEAISGFITALRDKNVETETDELVHGIRVDASRNICLVVLEAWTEEELIQLQSTVGELAGKHHMTVLDDKSWSLHLTSYYSSSRRFVVDDDWLDQEYKSRNAS